MNCLSGIPVVAKIKEDDIVHLALFERVPAPLFDKSSAFCREITKLSSALIGKKEKRHWFDKALFSDVKKEQVNREVLRKTFYKSMFE